MEREGRVGREHTNKFQDDGTYEPFHPYFFVLHGRRLYPDEYKRHDGQHKKSHEEKGAEQKSRQHVNHHHLRITFFISECNFFCLLHPTKMLKATVGTHKNI